MSFFKEFKDDLSQAVNELLPEEGMNEIDDEAIVNTLGEIAEEMDEKDAEEILAEDMPEEIQEEVEDTSTEDILSSMVSKLAAEQEEEQQPVHEHAATAEKAIITKGMKIIGDVEADGSIELTGTITGSVKCGGKLLVTGKIVGNSNAQEVFADGARIEGDIHSEGAVKIGAGTVIIGDVYATSAVVAGAVKGNVDVHGPVVIDSSAVVMGDIKSRSVQINIGAVTEGYCSQCYAQTDAKKFFDDATATNGKKKNSK